MEITHSLLKRQWKRCFGEGYEVPVSWQEFLALVEEAYREFDTERDMLERSLELSSQELFESSSQMRAVFESIPDLLLRIDLQGVILDVKSGLIGDLAIDPNGLLGKRVQDVSLKQIGDHFLDTLQRVSQEKTVVTIEYSQMQQGHESFYEARLTPLLENQVVAIIRNITERKKAEQERKQIEIQFRNMQKMESIGQLAAGIAHEINTPTQYVSDNIQFLKDSFQNILSVLVSYADLFSHIKKKDVTPELVQSVEKKLSEADLEYRMEQVPMAISETVEGLDRITNIVHTMKEFSHPGGKEKIAADLNKAIESTVTVTRNEWKYLADLKLELDPSLPAVMCFLGEFNQVMLNLIINASHAINDVIKLNPGSKGLITISTRHDKEFVEVRVSDTGTGIPEKFRSRIFEPFFTTKEVGKGTGQGLSLVYACIVKKHGGNVSFESEEGKGTTFILQLPI